MVDHDDPKLVFEHKLREHVRSVREKLDRFDDMMDESNHRWDMKYEAADEGTWHLYSYRYDVRVKAAALDAAADLAVEMVRRQRYVKSLPALLSPPAPTTTSMVDEDGNTVDMGD